MNKTENAPGDTGAGTPAAGAATITIDGRVALVGLVIVAAVGGAVLVGRSGWSLPDIPTATASSSLWLVFLTGLLAGGMSCLAVQGGLLAATIAQREQARLEREAAAGGSVAAVFLFLVSKVVAYTLLGAVLGYVGSLVALTPRLQGLLQVAIGLFMIALALQMLNVHPMFRYVTFQTPKWAQRTLRRQSKRSDALAPVALGALTVLMPCGVTQAMELLAIGSGDPVRGALIMFAFTLGTVPVFFLLGVLASTIGRAWQRAFVRISAVVVAVLAGLMLLTGLRLLGVAPDLQARGPATVANQSAGTYQEARIDVKDHGYEPSRIQVRSGVPIHLRLVTDNTRGCARAFTIPAYDVMRVLPETGEDVVELPPLQPGQIAFSCSMGMYTGVIEVVQ